MNDRELTGSVIECAMKIHTSLGPGLLESVYEVCLAHELEKKGFRVKRQLVLPIRYGDIEIDAGYRLDLLVNDELIVELKAVDKLLPVHQAQLLSYLKLSKKRIGLLLNFNVVHFREGIKRLVN